LVVRVLVWLLTSQNIAVLEILIVLRSVSQIVILRFLRLLVLWLIAMPMMMQLALSLAMEQIT
jgi:hypothetical protein